MSMATSSPDGTSLGERLRAAIAHFEHLLPGQAPLKDFVHHNTLHGYQQDSFPVALQKVRARTGQQGYLPVERFRALYQQGRITKEDLLQVINADPDLESGESIDIDNHLSFYKREVYLCGLLYPFQRVTHSQLFWNMEERSALKRFQDDLPEEKRQQLLAKSGFKAESTLLEDLWSACLQVLGLNSQPLHPEELLDLSPNQAESLFNAYFEPVDVDNNSELQVDEHLRQEVESLLETMLHRLGKEITLRGLLHMWSGKDILKEIRPLLIRQLGNHLDLGVAAWHSDERAKGFYSCWRQSAKRDLIWLFEDLPDQLSL
ncbi:MAG: DUF2309 domain-containing protein, partial [Magnetococcus sp. DMHC-6]